MKKITILLTFLLSSHLLADVEKGKAVYAANCAICHTVNGGNALGPDLNIVAYTRKKEDIAHCSTKWSDKRDSIKESRQQKQ